MTMPTGPVSVPRLASVELPPLLLPLLTPLPLPLLTPLLLGWVDASFVDPASKTLTLSSELPHATVAALTPTLIASRQID
jgi:hypothetical protein